MLKILMSVNFFSLSTDFHADGASSGGSVRPGP